MVAITTASPWTVTRLQAFEERVKEAFLAGKIRAPVHLSGGNEAPLIEIFRGVRPNDWVFSTWRSHYHALLHGIPEEWLWVEILAGRSMYLMNAEHHFFSSAIVGGTLPIAVGVAAGLKRRGRDERVWCFVGDMAAKHGAFLEAVQYASGFNLPLTFVIEDNGLSTNTPTAGVWGEHFNSHELEDSQIRVLRYGYHRTVPHVGAGKFVVFQ